MLKIVNCKNEAGVGAVAANEIAEVIRNKLDAVIGLATGSSPLTTYAELINKYKNGEISFEKVTSINLDEYAGLSADHEQSYSHFMHKNLFNHVNINEKNVNIPNGLASDYEAECKRYDAVIKEAGGVDVQLLGIGQNGHIGFNEPSDHFPVGTSLVELTDSTIDANSRFFTSRGLVPTMAISMGIGDIMAAKKIVMVVIGKEKAEIMESAFFGRVTPAVPASILQFFKGDMMVCADEEALSLIKKKHPEAVYKI